MDQLKDLIQTLKNKEEEIQQLMDYCKTLESKIIEYKNFKHNYINVLATLNGYIEEDDMEALSEYFYKEISPERNKLSSFESPLINLDNIKGIPALKGLLTFKILSGINLGLNFRVEIYNKVDKVSMGTIELSKFLGILLDNAIEESLESKEKIVYLWLLSSEDSVTITIGNSFKNKPDLHKIFQQSYSTKGEGRGMGLNYIRKTIEEFHSNVLLNTLIEGNVFKQELHIRNEKKSKA